MEPDTTTALPLRRAGLRARYDGEEAVLVGSDGSEAGVLNGTAVALWELCDGRTTAEEMAAAVCDAYSMDAATARREVAAALRQLRRAGFILEPAEHAGRAVQEEAEARATRPAGP